MIKPLEKRRLAGMMFAVALALTAVSSVVYAQDATVQTIETSSLITTLLEKINALEAKVASLTAAVLNSTTSTTASSTVQVQATTTPDIKRKLWKGMQGEDIRSLQQYLKQHDGVYPEGLVTGFFGDATFKAVMKLETKLGLPVDGVVDEALLAKIKEVQLAKHANASSTASTTASTTKPVADGQGGGIKLCHKPDAKGNGETISVGIMALFAHIAHGDRPGKCVEDRKDDKVKNASSTASTIEEKSGKRQKGKKDKTATTTATTTNSGSGSN